MLYIFCFKKLPLKEKTFKRERKVPSLILVWEKENEEPELRQEISIFTLVECVLEQGDGPLRWNVSPRDHG